MQISRTRRAAPTAEDAGEKRVSLAGLSLGESPRGAGSGGPRASLFRLAPPSAAAARKLMSRGGEHRSDNRDSSSHKSAASPTAGVVSGARRLMLPHTITERHGGRELWVRAPVVCGELDKRGFRWRRKWKPRYVELDGRELAYYDVDAGQGCGQSDRRRAAKRRVRLAASGSIEDVDALSFSVTPARGEPAWQLRARDAASKLRWCRALSDCLDILAWLQHYALGPVLGVGGNGVVQELVDTRDQSRSAVKIIDVAKFRNRDAVVAEVEILRSITNSIRHPNLIAIHKVYEEHGKVYIIQELCTGGELYDAVLHRGRYSERDAARLMRQLLSALQALHAHNILHLDLKPENILLASDDPRDARIKLTDFGLARMINGKHNPLENGASSMAGTVGYMAPEVITAHLYTEAADVFSAGVILFILLVGYPPFRGDSEVETLLKIARGDLQFDPEDWAGVSMPAKELVARMLQVRAQDRISVDAALAHPWITQLDEQPKGAVDAAPASDALDASDASDAAPTDHMLDKAVERLQRFNFDRKSENMGSLMGSLLLLGDPETMDADSKELLDPATIDSMIRQLSPDGRDRIPLDRAHVMARGLGLSPFVDVDSFVAFLDQNRDGFIDAGDFCAGVRAMRSHDRSFAAVIFAALCKMVGVAGSPSPRLARRHFAAALDQLECPKPLQKVFFKQVDEQQAAAAAAGTTATSSTDVEWSVDESGVVALMDQFSFLGLLFLRTAKENIVSIVRARSVDDMPRISEGSLSLSQSP